LLFEISFEREQVKPKQQIIFKFLKL
jgi:hypothetical protein